MSTSQTFPKKIYLAHVCVYILDINKLEYSAGWSWSMASPTNRCQLSSLNLSRSRLPPASSSKSWRREPQYQLYTVQHDSETRMTDASQTGINWQYAFTDAGCMTCKPHNPVNISFAAIVGGKWHELSEKKKLMRYPIKISRYFPSVLSSFGHQFAYS